MPTLDQWVAKGGNDQTYAAYVDHFIVGLIQRVGLKVKIRRTPTTTTLTIHLRRGEQTS